MQQLMQLLLYSTGPNFSACNNMYTHDQFLIFRPSEITSGAFSDHLWFQMT